MSQTRIDSDVYVTGNISSQTLTIPAGTVKNADVSASAGIDATKLKHQHHINYSQDSAEEAAADERVVHTVYGTSGTIVAVQAGMVAAHAGNATATVDLHVNGSSVLSAAITLSSSQSAYELVSGTIADDSLSADDVLEIVVAANAGTGTLGDGVFASVVIREDAA
jgi:hypothetical protein